MSAAEGNCPRCLGTGEALPHESKDGHAGYCKDCGGTGELTATGQQQTRLGSRKCDYTETPPFANAEWANDPDPLCFWCAGTGHPHGDESYGICTCPALQTQPEGSAE